MNPSDPKAELAPSIQSPKTVFGGFPRAVVATVRAAGVLISSGLLYPLPGLAAANPSAKPAFEEAAAGVRVTQVSADETRVGNSFVLLVARRGGAGVECHYRLGGQMLQGPTLAAAAGEGDRAAAIASVRAVATNSAEARLEVISTTASGRGIVAIYVLRANSPGVEARAGDGMDRLLVEGRSRYAVVPDIFAGDFVIDPVAVQPARLRMPSENLLLQLTDDGNAIVACAWRSGEQAVRLAVEGSGDSRVIIATEIGCRRDSPVVVAVLAAPGIWHAAAVKSLGPVKDTKLDWKVPFRALWRADFPRTDGLVDSWKCILRDPKGDYEGFGVVPKKSRTVWTSARGTFAYPVCIDGDDCFLRKTKFESWPDIKYDDERSVVTYPYRAIKGSPAGTFGAIDVLGEALRGTPQASLLGNLEIKHLERDRWPATCDVTADYEKVFDAGEEKGKKQFILERLEAMDNFVIYVRHRMSEYLEWQKKTRAFLAKIKTDRPQLAALAEEFDGILAKFGQVYERRKLDERTPAAARELIEKVSALIESNEEKKDEKSKQLGRETRTIGGNQDSAIGEFRMFTKRLRQRAAQRMAEAPDDVVFEFAREVRQRTMEMLHCAHGHESAQTD